MHVRQNRKSSHDEYRHDFDSTLIHEVSLASVTPLRKDTTRAHHTHAHHTHTHTHTHTPRDAAHAPHCSTSTPHAKGQRSSVSSTLPHAREERKTCLNTARAEAVFLLLIRALANSRTRGGTQNGTLAYDEEIAHYGDPSYPCPKLPPPEHTFSSDRWRCVDVLFLCSSSSLLLRTSAGPDCMLR
eukprot:3244042-Rhodomonas_salina.4